MLEKKIFSFPRHQSSSEFEKVAAVKATYPKGGLIDAGLLETCVFDGETAGE